MEVRDTRSYIEDVKTANGSRKSSNISFYLNNVIYTRLGTVIIKPSYQIGTHWFHSKKDLDDLMDIEPKLQYDLIKLYAYYNTRINLPLLTKTQVIDQNTGKPAMREIKTKDSKENKIVKTEPIKVRNRLPLYYTLTFDSQYSFDTLYGSDQFSVEVNTQSEVLGRAI